MRVFLLVIFILKGVLLSATVDSIEVKGVKVPIIYERDSTLPIAYMELIFKNSGSIEDNNHSGISSFTASILSEGTKKLGAVGFAKKLEDSAIDISVNRGNETFTVELSSLKEKFPDGVSYLLELLSDPNFSKESFEKTLLLKLASIDKKKSNFDYIAKVELKRLIFKGTPLENPSIGTQESLKSLTLNDIESFYSDHIVLKRAIVVVGGDLELNVAKEAAKKALSTLPVGKDSKSIRFNPLDQKKRVEVVKDTKQAYIYFGSPFYLKPDDKDAFKAKVASFILGSGGFGSRLMEEVRVKRGLAYSAYARVSLNVSHSIFSGYLQTKLQNQEDAIKLVKEVISNFVSNGATKEELEQAKKFIIGSEPLRNETLSQRLNRAFMEYYSKVGIGYHKKELDMIEKLTLEELNNFIKSHKEINNLSFAIVTKK